MLKEGVVNITPAEEQAIDSFVKDLGRFHKKRRKIHPDDSDMAICAALRDYANDVAAPKYKLNNIFWRFFAEPKSNTRAQYDTFKDEIHINLYKYVESSIHPLNKQDINFETISIDLYHEWTHVKQNYKYYDKKGSPASMDVVYGKKEYFDSPWEQMAFARQEIEWIKRNVKKTDPKLVLKWMQKWGLLSNPQLQNLKKKNPKAYNRILKYAVLFILKQEARKATSKKAS